MTDNEQSEKPKKPKEPEKPKPKPIGIRIDTFSDKPHKPKRPEPRTIKVVSDLRPSRAIENKQQQNTLMKDLELTEEKAKQLNAICKFAVEFGMYRPFDITYYQKQYPQFDINYYRHLIDVALQYENVNKLINLSAMATLSATHNTGEFLKSGGFLRIMKIEQREDKIQDFTLRSLRQSILGTKEWFLLIIITICVAVTTTLLTGRLSQKMQQQDSSQVPSQVQSSSSKIYQDSQTISYNDSLKEIKIDTLKK
jgi:hypothetical protein